MQEKIELVLVTGLSGAGKTTAMGIFEDMEYSCIDNYPVSLLEQFGELLKTSDEYNKIAMAVPINDALNAIKILKNMDWINLQIVFLDCENNIILTRYKFTRRVHPLLISNKALVFEVLSTVYNTSLITIFPFVSSSSKSSHPQMPSTRGSSFEPRIVSAKPVLTT